MITTSSQRTIRHNFVAYADSIEQVQQLAIERKTSVSSLIREAIYLYLKQQSKKGTLRGEIANQGA